MELQNNKGVNDVDAIRIPYEAPELQNLGPVHTVVMGLCDTCEGGTITNMAGNQS